METITDLIRDVPIPKMVKIRQNFDRTHIPETELAGVVTRELDREEIGERFCLGRKSPSLAAAGASPIMP